MLCCCSTTLAALVSALAALAAVTQSSSPSFRPSSKFDLLQYLGTKRPYPVDTPHADPVSPPPGYSLTQLFVISRHGTRYPSSEDIRKFIALGDHFRAYADMIPTAHEWARNWRSPFPMELANLLAPHGELDLYRFGKRTAVRYPQLFKNITYTSNLYKFRSSEVSRSGQSASAFAAGLFDGRGNAGCTQPVYITTVPKGLDQELAMKFACPRWLDEIHKSTRRTNEESDLISRRLAPAARRIGRAFKGVPMDVELVETIYRACSFLVAHFGDATTWCSVLEEQELFYLDYLADLGHFITYSYGSELNSHMGCPLASRLALLLQDAINTERKPAVKAEFMFGHAETIIFFATFLGLYRDSYALTGNLSDVGIRGRSFRTSLFAPFAANYQIELYSRQSPMSADPAHVIRFLVNERAVDIPLLNQSIAQRYYSADAVIGHLTRYGACRFIKECKRTVGDTFGDLFRQLVIQRP